MPRQTTRAGMTLVRLKTRTLSTKSRRFDSVRLNEEEAIRGAYCNGLLCVKNVQVRRRHVAIISFFERSKCRGLFVMCTSYSWHHKTDQKRKCNQSLHDMVVAPFLPRASRSLEGTVADLRKARGFCSSPGQHCTRAGNGRGYAIASCKAANDSA